MATMTAPAGTACLAVLLRDRFAYGRDDLAGPAAEGDHVRRAAFGREESEARRAVLQDGAGQFLCPLVDGAADPAAITVTRGGQRPVGDAPGGVVDRADLAWIAAHSRRRFVDDGS